MDEITSVFVQESREQLAAMEDALLQLEASPDDDELVNAIFRPAHTIKGGAGVIECDFIVAFTHVVENALDRLRQHEIAVSGELIALLLACGDHIGKLLDVLEAEAGAPSPELAQAGAELLARLQQGWLGAPATPAGASQKTPPAETKPAVESSGGGAVDSDCWHISLRFGRDVLRNGMDPLSFLRYLGTLGDIMHMETIADAMPPAEEMNPESCYLGFEINFSSNATKDAIEGVFDFVRDDCELFILPPHSKLEDFVRLIEALPEDNMRLGEILVRIGALTEHELAQALHEQQATPPVPAADGETSVAAHPLGEILVEHKAVHPELVEAAVVKQKQVSEKKSAEARLIRIQADKLDRLIDLVGELVIAGSSVNLLAARAGLGELTEASSTLARLVEHIRDSALQLRMVQIGETFHRFNRVVRDVSKDLGKDIELVIEGAETELDKSVVEKIGDPLMHLVRNAMDHGIESASVRATRGKSARGRLGLNAYHDSGSIVIEVSDDGGGLNSQKILDKAVERGLVQPGQHLSEQEIFALIFEPGFSTAEQVSNLSGRGVGMDVVKRNIQSLRGRVEIHSTLGQGTRFAIRLPLTLAIIDGFLVGAGRASYVVPLDMVVECLELPAESRTRNYLNLRGEVLPFIRLRDLFEIDGERPRRENVVVVKAAGQKAGIVVDQLLGEFQTVIKPLGQLFRNLRGIGGSTILGSGEVALILDVQALVALSARQEEHLLSRHGPSLTA